MMNGFTFVGAERLTDTLLVATVAFLDTPAPAVEAEPLAKALAERDMPTVVFFLTDVTGNAAKCELRADLPLLLGFRVEEGTALDPGAVAVEESR